jgi:hypothetical protein
VYLIAKKNIYELFHKLNYKITNCKLLIFAYLVVGVNVLFVTMAGDGQKAEKHLRDRNAMCILCDKNWFFVMVHYLHEFRV